jgi:hypothetical protein
MSARPRSVSRHRSGIGLIGWLAVGLLAAITLAAGSEVRAVSAPSESPGAEATPTLTPDTTPTPDNTPDPDRPLLAAYVLATTRFACDRRGPDGTCFVDVDDRGLTFTAEFDGARVLQSDSYANRGFAFWWIELPGTATGIGPGGSVRVVLTAAPRNVFKAIDVDCVRAETPFEPERRIPSTLQGNSVSFEFDVTPTEDPPTCDCTFSFDQSTLPRFAPPPTLPPTDTIGGGSR